MRLYIQQLEERVRQLTGENEQLAHEVNQLRAQLGLPPLAASPEQTGAVTPERRQAMPSSPARTCRRRAAAGLAGASVAANDPLNAPDGAGAAGGAPVDLSTLAGGAAPILSSRAPAPSRPQPAAVPPRRRRLLAPTGAVRRRRRSPARRATNTTSPTATS